MRRALLAMSVLLVACSDTTGDPRPSVPVSDPVDVCESVSSLSPGLPVAFRSDLYASDVETATKALDCFAWKTLVALSWPSSDAYRGTPDLSSSLGDDESRFRVWETYKQPWEILQPTIADWNLAAVAWNDPAPEGLCPTTNATEKVLTAKTISFEDGLTLSDQNGATTWFEIRVNEDMFTYVRDEGLATTGSYSYAGPIGRDDIDFPVPSTGVSGVGSIVVKAAWKKIGDADDPSRYYVRDSVQVDGRDGPCAKVEMGLVGLHVVRKLDDTPKWIWMTFEHEDNVPPAGTLGDGRSYSYFSRECAESAPDDCWAQGSATSAEYICCPNITSVFMDPPQVTRIDPIRENSQIATGFRSLLADAESPLRHFQLVGVQWARPSSADPSSWQRPCNPTGSWGIPEPAPGEGCYTAIPDRLRNTTMEFEVVQTNPAAVQESSDSCLSCHDAAGRDGSFLWYNAMFGTYPVSSSN